MQPIIGKCDRDLQISSVIKSNLVGLDLSSEQIDKIKIEMTQDIADVLENYYHVNSRDDEVDLSC